MFMFCLKAVDFFFRSFEFSASKRSSVFFQTLVILSPCVFEQLDGELIRACGKPIDNRGRSIIARCWYSSSFCFVFLLKCSFQRRCPENSPDSTAVDKQALILLPCVFSTTGRRYDKSLWTTKLLREFQEFI